MQRTKMPRDPNQRAKATADIVDALLGDGDLPTDPLPAKDPGRVERGRKGGAKGGKLRAEKLTPERRSEIARKAAQARWSRSDAR